MLIWSCEAPFSSLVGPWPSVRPSLLRIRIALSGVKPGTRWPHRHALNSEGINQTQDKAQCWECIWKDVKSRESRECNGRNGEGRERGRRGVPYGWGEGSKTNFNALCMTSSMYIGMEAMSSFLLRWRETSPRLIKLNRARQYCPSTGSERPTPSSLSVGDVAVDEDKGIKLYDDEDMVAED